MAFMQGKTVLVTGGARRVGAAIVRRLHGAGANVLIHYRDSEADASLLVKELNSLRPKSASGVRADLAGRPRAIAANTDF